MSSKIAMCQNHVFKNAVKGVERLLVSSDEFDVTHKCSISIPLPKKWAIFMFVVIYI